MCDIPKRETTPEVAIGDVVRVYGSDDWFFEGHVISAGEEIVVQFSSWTEAFAPEILQETWPMMRRVLAANSRGRCVSGVQKSVDGEE